MSRLQGIGLTVRHGDPALAAGHREKHETPAHNGEMKWGARGMNQNFTPHEERSRRAPTCADVTLRVCVQVATSDRFRGLCASHAVELEPSPVPELDATRWSEVRAQVHSNAFGKRDAAGRWTLSLFRHVSVCNHSCSPNCALGIFDRGCAILYTIAPVEPGEEVRRPMAQKPFWPHVADNHLSHALPVGGH